MCFWDERVSLCFTESNISRKPNSQQLCTCSSCHLPAALTAPPPVIYHHGLRYAVTFNYGRLADSHITSQHGMRWQGNGWGDVHFFRNTPLITIRKIYDGIMLRAILCSYLYLLSWNKNIARKVLFYWEKADFNTIYTPHGVSVSLCVKWV